MKNGAIAAVLVIAGPTIALAQTTSGALSQAAVELNGDTPIDVLLASPKARALMLKYLPEIEKHPAFEQIKGMSLRQVAPFSGGAITDEMIASLEADLKAAK